MLYIVFALNEPPAKVPGTVVDTVIEPNGKELLSGQEEVPSNTTGTASIVNEEPNIKLFDIMFVFMDLYILVTHFSITMVNVVIMIKEA